MHDTGGKDRGIDGSMKLRDGETCSKTFCSPEIPGGSVVKNLSANAGDMGDLISMLGLGRSSGGGNGSPLHRSRESHGQRSLATTVCRVIKSRTAPSACPHTHSNVLSAVNPGHS